MKNGVRALGLVMLISSTGACGGQIDHPQSSRANVDEKPGSSAEAPEKSEPPAKPATPATMEEVLQAIDLRQLPKLAGAKVQAAKGSQLHYLAPGRLDEAAALYRNKLCELGWTEDKTSIPGLDPEKYVSLKFDKADFCIYFSTNLSDKKGIIDVYLSNSGNVDPRLLPQLTDAKPTISNRNYVSYKTAAKPEAVIDFYRKEITARGWKEHRVASAKFHAKEGRFLVGFDKNAMDLLLNIKEEKEGQTVVEYSVSVLDKPVRAEAKDLPKPATLDEGKKIIDLNRFPRLEGATPGQGSSALFQYDAPGSVAQALSFYRQKFEAQGWAEEPGYHEDDEMAIIHFAKAGFLLELHVGKSDKAGRVRIQIENKGNVDARLLPHLVDAPEGELETFGLVHYETETPKQDAVEFYRQELSKQGWKELKSDGKDYPDGSKSLAFSQNAILLKVEIGPSADGGNNVRLEPRLYGQIIPRPGDPEAARGVIDLRKFPLLNDRARASASSAAVHYAASGKVADATRFYRKELSAKGWTEQMPPPIENDDRATLRFGKRGFILEVSILTLDGGPGVGISVDNRGNLDTRELLHLEDAKLDASSVQEQARYTTSATPDVAVEFYRHEIPKFGWEESKGPGGSHVQLDGIYLVFVQKGMKVQVTVCANPERKTDVQVQAWVIGEGASSDKLKATNLPPSSPDKATAAGLQPKDFPIPDDAVDAKFMAGPKTVEFKSPSTISKLMEFYRKELKSRDWSEDNKVPVLGEIGLCTFKKGKASLTITMSRDGDMTAVTVLTQGVEWK
jgi:hypothetical protein